jgi:hypothetical protein
LRLAMSLAIAILFHDGIGLIVPGFRNAYNSRSGTCLHSLRPCYESSAREGCYLQSLLATSREARTCGANAVEVLPNMGMYNNGISTEDIR